MDTLISDDGDGKADPGGTEKIEYTVTISNTGTDASSVVFTDDIDDHTTLVPGSINTQPIADPDTYTASGNIAISLAAPGVLTNDRDPDTGNNSGLTVTKVQGVGANVGVATDTTATGRGSVKGSVTLSSDGGFTYEPPPGFEGADTFTYETSDGTKTDTATVTINISGMVWFISNSAGGLNRGTFTNPFTTMASFNTANAGTGVAPDPKNNDFISLRTGTGTYSETDGINLRAQQKLIGNAVQFNTVFSASANSNSAYTTFAGAVGTAPTITTTGGNGVDLSTDNTLRGFNVGAVSGSFFKINGTAVGNLVLNTLGASGGGAALNVSTSGAFGSNVTFSTLESTSANGVANVNLVNVTGTLGATAGGTGLTNNLALPIISISGGSVNFSYPGSVSRTSGTGTLMSVLGGHTGTLTFVSVSGSTGAGLSFDNADGSYTFNTAFSLSGGTAGINITNGSAGTFNWAAVSTITGITGIPLNVGTSPGNPTITYSGSITHNNAGTRAVNVDGTSGNSISINSVTAGSVAGGVGNTGINVNNANGSVSFTTLNLGTSGTRMTQTAVTIAGGSGAKSLGTISIFTTGAAEGIHSTTTTGSISVTAGSCNSAGAAAINIAGTSAASRTPLNVQLTSLAANGGAKGLVLLNTSATGSPGGFRINGTGTTDGSGGTIQNTTTRGADIQTAESIVLKNMNFTNANSSVDGGSAGSCDDTTITGCNSAIYLNGVTTLATFDNLSLTGTMVENGVTAIGVANFKFDNSLIDGAGNEVHESGIEAQNLSGTATVNSTEIRFSETDAFAVTNTDTSVNLTINGSTFRDSQTQSSGGPVNTNGEGGFQFRSFSILAGQPTATINVINSSFLRLRTQAIQPFALDDTILNIDITGCTLDAQSDIGTGIDLNSDDSATVSFNILNNPTIQSRGGSAVNITSFLSSHMEGRLNNNPDIEVLGSAGIPVRLVAQETSQMIVEINGNTISNVNGTEDTAIDVQSRFQTARVDATITNNTVTPEITGVAGINLISGSSTSGEANITCGDVANNNVTNAAGNTVRAHRIRISDLSNTNRIFLEGFVDGGGTATDDTEATWNARGNQPVSAGGNEVTASLTGTAVGPLAPPGGLCQAVDTAADFASSFSSDGMAKVSKPVAAPGAPKAQPVESPATSSAQPSVVSKTASVTMPVAATTASNNRVAAARKEQPRAVKATETRSGKTFSNHAKLRSPRAIMAAAMSGENVTRNIGTLRAGDSVTITFQVTVDNPPNLTQLTPPRVSNQGSVAYNDGVTPQAPVLTDDPAVAGMNDPTETLVDLFDTATALVSDLNPSNFGDLVTFTATVSETPTQASADPAGTVDFIDTSNGNAVICNDVALTAGSAQCQTSTLTSGTHNIRADYSGDGNFDPSQSNVVAQVVNACTPDPIVTSTADAGPNTLREALANVCNGDVITFNLTGAGPHTITLTTGELQVAKDVTINNNSGESITVSGNNASRVFNINSGKTAAIIGLTISGGSDTDGGGVFNDGALTVVNSTLSGNAVTAEGGAIASTATATSLTLINTTVSGNSAGGNGGGVIILGGTVTFINATITNNTADSDNNAVGAGGGIRAHAGTITLKNTIVAGNFNEDGASDAADDISGTVDAASSFNLIGTGGAGGLTNGVNNNQVGVANAGLGALGNNGGTTQTHALLPTSLAVEAGGNANLPADVFDLDGDTNVAETLPVDQRGTGFPRTADSQDANTTQTVDVGAFELHPSIEDIPNQTTAEDMPKLVTFNLGDDTGALIATVTATSSNTALVTSDGAHLSFSGSGGSRTLTITPNTDANSLANGGTTTITVTVTATNGRTAVDTFDLTVTEVNDAPDAVNDTLSAIDEDSGTRIIPFTDLLTNDSKGPANESGQTITVTNVSNPVGGTVVINGTNVEFTPTANFFGPASFDYTITDNGTTNGVADPKSDTASVSFTINAINDPPSFVKGADQTINEDAGLQTVAGWATSISAGPNEIQNLTFNVSVTGTTGNLAFSSAPAVSAAGTLTYTTAADTNGTATVSVTLSDDGPNSPPPNSNTSAAQTFNITVNAVNDRPTFQLGANPSVGEDAGPQTINSFAFNFQPGPVTATDESGQTLVGYTVTQTGSTGGLTFSSTPAISNAGTLTFTATNNSSGSATFDVVATDSGSGTPPNLNQSLAVSFTINVGAVNDPPVNTVPGPQGTNQNTPLVFSSGNGNQISVADADAGTNTVQVTLTAANGTITLSGTSGLSFSFSDGNGTGTGDGTNDPTMTFRGTLTNINAALNGMTFNPTPGFSGAAGLTIISNDLGNTGSGGPQTDTDVVNIQVSTNISIQDAKVAEPPLFQTTNMIFTVTLSAPAPGTGTSVNFTTVELLPSIIHAKSPQDYTTVSGTLNFAPGEQIKTIQVPVHGDLVGESNETFQVVLSSPVNGTIADGTATGTILMMDQAGALLISELRTSGPAGAGDDFVEIYNNSDSPHTVNDGSGINDSAHGYGLFKMGAGCTATPVLIGVIPNGTVIPARGHYLFVGSTYSLSGAAAGDQTMLSDIENDRNVALFTTASLAAISSAGRLDAVGFGSNTGNVCDLFREGQTLTPLSGSVLEHSYFRDECGKKANLLWFGTCPTNGLVQDLNKNEDDFIFADVSAANTAAGQRLGTPGPQNLGSPRVNLTTILAPQLDSTKLGVLPPNRVRNFTPVTNGAAGTLSIRRRFVNNTGAPVTRLRFRIIDVTAFTLFGSGIADLRALTSPDISVGGITDSATCAAEPGSPATPCTVVVRGTTLETPPNQPLGGGLNSTLSAGTITLAQPLANGASINLQFLLGVQQIGAFKFYFNIEALP